MQAEQKDAWVSSELSLKLDSGSTGHRWRLLRCVGLQSHINTLLIIYLIVEVNVYK